MAKTVLGALEELWAGDAQLTNLVPAGLWVGSVPPEKVLPFAALLHLGETPLYTSEAETVEETRVRFECFAEAGTSAGQANPAEAIAARAKVVFDKLGRAQPLDVDGYQTISVLRTRYQVAEEARRAPDVNRVHRVTLDYSVRLSHDLPR